MAIFGRTREPEGGAISGGRGPAIPSPSRDKEAGGANVITGLTKVKEEVRALREAVSALTQSFQTLSKIMASLSRPVNTSAEEEKERRRRREEKRERRREKERRKERREKRGRL